MENHSPFKATLPNSANKLQGELYIDATNLTMFYSLPKLVVCLETYLRDFQFKVLNYVTCTNILLKKMRTVESDLCTYLLVVRSLSYFGKILSYAGRNVRILILI